MTRVLRTVLVAALVASGALMGAGLARADVSNGQANNIQDGQNRTSGSQSGKSKTGSAVGGQVSGVVSGGKTSIDAKNTSKNSDVSTGNATGTNSTSSYTGLNSSDQGPTITADITNVCTGANPDCDNLQSGDNRATFNQTANYTTGDGVAGQVIGAVTSGRGSTSIVAANNSDGVDVQTGNASGTNALSAFAGLNDSDQGPVLTSDISGSCGAGGGCDNVQQGGNTISAQQSSTAHSGDGVAGQVIGAVTSDPSLSIDARNTTTDSTVETGDAKGVNRASFFAGLNASDTGPTVTATDVTSSCNGDSECANVQEGDNRVSANQTADSTSGDGVAGQVIGAVSSGPASIVASNTTKNSDVTTGNSDAANHLSTFVGLNFSEGGPAITSDLTNVCNNTGEGCANVQQGDNRLTGSQTAHAITGDGVAGEVIGLVSAGRASLDATNTSDGSSADTGNAKATNSASSFVGLNNSATATVVADVSNVVASNVQEGDNRKNLSQSADASSGDGVAGQVTGVVTSAGGSASVVLANTSNEISSDTGNSDFKNTDSGFVGLNFSAGSVLVG